ncbi:uncharacterized protein [Typha latifolia]|uniref:uncharacterized protein n=1 Tax=Typha latifolia TaxID=4733 RepID=UPI003C2CDA42
MASPISSSAQGKPIPLDRGKNSEPNPWEERDYGALQFGVLLFGLIGASAATVALRRTVNGFSSQFNRSESYSSRGGATCSSNRRHQAWSRCNCRVQEEYDYEMERVEHIKRMQSVFNRERSKSKKSYGTWKDHGPGAYQHFPREDLYWKTEEYYKDQRTNFRSSFNENANCVMSYHYSVLGLDRSRSVPYSDAEIKAAFRTKAMEYHPDQNQKNKKAAEAKFKEVMVSYEAIKLERSGRSC